MYLCLCNKCAINTMLNMQNKLLFIISSLIITANFVVPVFADETPDSPALYFRAVNAGYKDDQSSQNYDFFEISKASSEDLDVSPYTIQYYNSSDKFVSELSFPESTFLRAERVVFGFNGSPQYADASPLYQYDFSSSGLASTAGRLRIMNGDKIVDEVCWGKTTCEQNVPKFATSESDNRTAVLCRSEDCLEPYSLEQYYPNINEDVFYEPEPEVISLCSELKISEIYAYYEESAQEQFVELYNPSDSEKNLTHCSLRYKNNIYPLSGDISAHGYLIIQDIPLTKNPSSELTIELFDASGIIDAASYPSQKKGTSVIVLDGQ